MTIPKISVIVTDHDRKDYIMECLKSVLDQTLSREFYEIIVIKNFDDTIIDNFINENKIMCKKPNGNAIGEKFVIGAENATGEILCIINDDDLFAKNKLEYILNLFTEHEDLIYYHNSFIKIGEHGEIIDNSIMLKNLIINTNNIEKKLIKDALSGFNIFNDSCISIKRKVISKYKEQLIKVKGNQDTILFLLSSTFNGILISNNEKLTYFRMHNSVSQFSKTNIEEDIKKFNGLINRRLESYQSILPIFIGKNILSKYVECNHRSNFLQSLIFEDVKRIIILHETLKFMKCPFNVSFITRFLLIIIMFLKIVNKNIVYKHISKLIFKYY